MSHTAPGPYVFMRLNEVILVNNLMLSLTKKQSFFGENVMNVFIKHVILQGVVNCDINNSFYQLKLAN